FAALQQSARLPLVFVMDTPREALYANRHPRTLEVFTLNQLAADAAARADLTFVDLTDAFVQDFDRRHERFDFATDNHWNALGHEVAARAAVPAVSAALSPSAATR